MSKSDDESTAIFLKDSPKELEKKIMRAVTDSGPTERNQKKPEAIDNIFLLLKHVSSPDTVAVFEEKYNDMTIRYGDLKKQLAVDMIKYLEPIREKIEAIRADDAYLKKVLKDGTEKARESASRTLSEVRKAVGFSH